MKKLVLAAGLIGVIAGSSLMAQSYTTYTYVDVEKSEPITREVTIRKPVQECWDEQVVEDNSNSNGTAGGLIGGVAGGILGHQVGKGSGKTAATIGGAIVGTLVGSNLEKNNNNGPTYKTVRKCRSRYEEQRELRTTGYRNYANYNGHEIVKISNKPLRRIKIYTTINY